MINAHIHSVTFRVVVVVCYVVRILEDNCHQHVVFS